MHQRILIIIPCYNEETALPAVLRDLKAIKQFNLTILVVNDCSKDRTAEVARQQGIRLLDLPVNLGIGGAMQTGYKFAHRNSFDLAIQLDGDGQHLPSELHKLIDHHNATGDSVVIGSRFVQKTAYRSQWSRRTGIFYFQLLYKVLLNRKIYDCTSGFRLFDKKAIAVAAQVYPDDYPEPESLILFSKLGMNIAEVPVLMQQRQGGASSIGSVSGVYYMIKVTMAIIYSFIRYSQKKTWNAFRS